MALHKRKEFYEKCGVSKSYLNVYISRKKVVLTGKMIDDQIPVNAQFLEEQLKKRAIEKLEQVATGDVTKVPKIVSEEEVEEIGKEEEEVDPDVKTTYNLGLEKLRLANEKAKEDLEISRMKKESMAGELIPTDLVLVIFASHFKSVTTAFHQATDNIISTIAKKNDLKREAVAEFRGVIIEEINKAVANGLSASKKEVASLVREYKQKRGRGESK